ncbi:MAG: hypothetical protein ACI358_00745 [Candidatus Limimorpha sp.]
MKNADTDIRFGIMVNSSIVERWQYDTIKLLIDNGVKLSLVIENADTTREYRSLWDKVKRYPYKTLLFRVWNRFLLKPKSKEPVCLQDLTENVSVLRCIPEKKGISTYFNGDDIEKIKSYGLDFILRFGFNIVRGEILNCAKHGIWSYHHDDERVVRGGPPGFWEFMRKIPENGVILQRLTDKLDKGLIISRLRFNTQFHSYKLHLDTLLTQSEYMPLQACMVLKSKGSIDTAVSQSDAPILHPPKNLQMLRYFWLCFWRKIVFHLNYLFKQEDWNVGYCFYPIGDFISSDSRESLDIHWLKDCNTNVDRQEYLADPFVITTRRDTYLFFEWFSNKKGKADLAVAKMSEHFNTLYKISDFPEHRSFPFVFENDGVVYCLPEANKTNKVTLYRFNEETLSLQYDCDLLTGGAFVDAALYRHNGLWYLFLTPKEQSHTHLIIYMSRDMRGPYEPHRMNPVKIDCKCSRQGGKIFEINGKIIRPSQNSTEHYGQSIVLNEIMELSEDSFVEKETMEIRPLGNTKYNKGLHTINGNGEITVFDVKRFTFTLSGFIQQLKQRLL